MITEKDAWFINGYLAIAIQAVVIVVAVYSFIQGELGMGLTFMFIALVLASGFSIIQPNQAVNVQFAGKYVGTYRQEGVAMFIPFSKRKRVSLRERIFQSENIAVHDVKGKPVTMSVVILFKIVDAAKAVFDVENMESYISIQTEMSVRSQITEYAYETLLTDDALLNNVTKEFKVDLYDRLHRAGVDLTEIRLIPSLMTDEQTVSDQHKMKDSIKLTEKLLQFMEKEKIITLNDENRDVIKNKLTMSLSKES